MRRPLDEVYAGSLTHGEEEACVDRGPLGRHLRGGPDDQVCRFRHLPALRREQHRLPRASSGYGLPGRLALQHIATRGGPREASRVVRAGRPPVRSRAHLSYGSLSSEREEAGPRQQLPGDRDDKAQRQVFQWCSRGPPTRTLSS